MNEVTFTEIEQQGEYNYIEERVQGQLNYYHNTCKKLQRYNRIFTITSIVVTAIIPVISLLNVTFSALIVAILGALASICTSISFFEKYKDRWLQYRTTQERLKSELAKYKTHSCYYKSCDPEESKNLFVENCETILEHEHFEWAEIMNKEH